MDKKNMKIKMINIKNMRKTINKKIIAMIEKMINIKVLMVKRQESTINL